MSYPSSRRRRLAGLVMAAATALTALAVSTPAQSQTVGTLRTGENFRRPGLPGTRAHDVPGIAVNPANAQNIVQVERDINLQDCFANASFDGGQTWSSTALVPPAGFPPPGSPATLPSCPAPANPFSNGYEGSVAFGNANRVYTAFGAARTTAGAGSSAFVARSNDGGKTWGQGVLAMNNAGTALPNYNSPELAVQPGAGAGGADRVYLMAEYNVAIGSPPATNFGRVAVNVSNDGGQTWSAPVEITGASNAFADAASCAGNTACSTRAEPSAPVITAGGLVSVAYRLTDAAVSGQPSPVTSTIQVARSTNQGATWTQVSVTPVRGYVDESGARFNGSNYPRQAGDARNENLYITYMEGPPPGGRADHFIHPDVDTMFTRSLNGGQTWSAPIRVNDDPPGNGAPATGPAQRHPRVGVAPDGRVDVVWQDRRHGYRSPTHSHLGNGEARMGDTYWAYSLDAGATFSKNRRVSDKMQNLDIGYDHYGQEYWRWGPVLAEIGNNDIIFAWPDSREGNVDDETVDIYMARTSVQAPDTVPVQRLEAGVPALSVALSKYAYTGGPQAVLNVGFTNRPVTRPVIVHEGDAVGALVGSVLSRAYLGPLLTSTSAGLTADVKAEVTRMAPLGAFVLGDTTTLPDTVVTNLVSAGVPADEVVRFGGAPADMARAVALQLDRRTDAQKAAAAPAFDAVVVVNPGTPEAFAAAGMAASLRLPILFTERDAVPAATSGALAALNITTTLVVGGPGAVSDAVLGSLPGAKRLGGADPVAVSRSVVAESVARRLQTNIVHVVDAAQPMDAGLSAAALARTGGLQLLAPGADTDQALASLDALGLRAGLDRLVVVRSATGPGYRLAARDGGVFAFGGAGFFGSTGAMRLNKPVVGMANTPANVGYWLVASDGGVFAFGDARFFGSTGDKRLTQPVVGMAPTPSGNGYWLVASDGGVFAFGDAGFYGSTGAMRLSRPIVGLAPTPTGKGYWLVGSDGGVFAFGDATFKGSTGAMKLARPVVGIDATPSGDGYWLAAADGGIFAFGDAPFKGSTGGMKLNQPVVGVDATSTGAGYLLVASDGGVFAFGDARFAGSTGGMKLNQPVVDLAAS
ncbi:MAG TPA: cell wall-binding repeat-containing protein [Acidimicrobiales bacterium]|nr:cell wall-binding repeat-containing protein [Acidimicrobiales bacterium]